MERDWGSDVGVSVAVDASVSVGVAVSEGDPPPSPGALEHPARDAAKIAPETVAVARTGNDGGAGRASPLIPVTAS
jgi:hypothetical protein